MEETNKTKKYIQAAAFFLFIVGLPMGSWYYLQAGFDYHKDLMSELKNYGRIPEFSLVNQDGDTITRKDVEEKVLVIDFYNSEKQSYSKTMDYLRRFSNQFHDRNDLVFLSHSLHQKSLSTEELQTAVTKENLDNDQNEFLQGSSDELLKILSTAYKIPDIENRAEDKTIPRNGDLKVLPDEYPYFILVDDSGTIRNYYNIYDEKAVTHLVEHLALILPRKAEEKAQLKREKEK
jgi:protein SCO1